MFKIEKDVPMPNLTKKADLFPFTHMEVGDSFLVAFDDHNDTAALKRYVAGAINSINQKHINADGEPVKKWAMRSGSDGVRVWRTL